MEAMGATQRCLILSDCKAALEAIELLEREYRGQTPHNANRRTLLTAIHAQLAALRRKEGYAIFLWMPGHGGVAPNTVADATAKTYLTADHDRLIARDLAKHEHRRPCVYVQADTGDLRNRGLYREVKRASRQWIVQQLGGAPEMASQHRTAQR